MKHELDDVLRERLERLGDEGLRRTLLDVASAVDGRIDLGGRSYLDLGSNDYLGLANAPLDRSRLTEAPSGARASRLVTGNTLAHTELEMALARYVGLETSLLFTSGFAANVGTIPALVGKGDLILSDELNHASLIDGCRLSRARVQVFRHGDLDHLQSLLATHRAAHRHALIVTESVFSMQATVADLRRLRAVADDARAWLMVDEAHSLGVIGPGGSGSCHAAGVLPEVLVGTLGKALGAAGAFIAGSATLRELLIHRARSFVFTTGVPPLMVEVVRQRLAQVLEADLARRDQAALVRRLKQGLERLGFETLGGEGPILAVVLGEPARAVAAEAELLERGILARAIRPPTVPAGTSRIRLVPTATHSRADIDHVLGAFEAVRR